MELEFTDGEYEWYQCDPNEYVNDGIVYRKNSKEESIEIDAYYCPICDTYNESSDYLSSEFKDDLKMVWLSNMVTHFRHVDHRKGKVGKSTSYDRTWGEGGYGWNRLHSITHDDTKKSKMKLKNEK